MRGAMLMSVGLLASVSCTWWVQADPPRGLPGPRLAPGPTATTLGPAWSGAPGSPAEIQVEAGPVTAAPEITVERCTDVAGDQRGGLVRIERVGTAPAPVGDAVDALARHMDRAMRHVFGVLGTGWGYLCGHGVGPIVTVGRYADVDRATRAVVAYLDARRLTLAVTVDLIATVEVGVDHPHHPGTSECVNPGCFLR